MTTRTGLKALPTLARRSLDAEHIRNIIESYKIPTDVARRYAELCSGSPRFAHVIGENLVEPSGRPAQTSERQSIFGSDTLLVDSDPDSSRN